MQRANSQLRNEEMYTAVMWLLGPLAWSCHVVKRSSATLCTGYPLRPIEAGRRGQLLSSVGLVRYCDLLEAAWLDALG